MSALTAVVLAGGAVGGGLWLVATGWSPARPPLAQTLARLGQPVRQAVETESRDLDARVGSWARRVSLVERTVASVATDLRVLRRSPDEQAAAVVAYTLCGLLWAPVVAAGMWLLGFRLPLVVPLWSSLLGGALGGFVSIRSVRTQAKQSRRLWSHALGSFCDVVAMSLAAGRGIDSSIRLAARAGEGAPFSELDAALTSGYMQGATAWEALDRLAHDCDLPDLAELAAALSLAGAESAAVRVTVASKARSIRERLTDTAEHDAAAVTERMTLPGTFLLFGFVIWISFPSIVLLFE